MTVGRVVRSHAQAVRYVRTLARHTDSDPNRTNHEVATHMSRTFRPPFSRMWQAVAMGALIAAGVMLLVGAASGGLSATAAEASSADSVPGTHRQSGSRAPGELAGAVPVGQFAPGATAPTWKGAVTLTKCASSRSDSVYAQHITLDRSGTALVTERYGDCLHRIEADGSQSATGGSGGHSGAIVIAHDGLRYMAEDRRLRVVLETGKFLGYVEPDPKQVSSSWASSMAVGPDHSIWLTDSELNRVENWSADGRFLKAWGGFGSLGSTFRYPAGIAVDQAGNVYVVETVGHQVQKLAPDGTVITAWGRSGARPGEFLVPSGIALDSTGNVYVADEEGARVQKFSPDGNYLACWGDGCTTQPQIGGSWIFAAGIAVDRLGAIYIPHGGAVRRYLPTEGRPASDSALEADPWVALNTIGLNDRLSLADPPRAAVSALPRGTIEAVRAEVAQWGGFVGDASWFMLTGDALPGPIIIASSQRGEPASRGNGGCGDYLAWSVAEGRTVWQGQGCRDVFARIEGDNGFVITSPIWLPTDSHCCNSFEVAHGHIWDGNTFVPRGYVVSERPH